MSRHRRELGLLAILVRLGWQRDPTLWTIPCLDGHGRRARLSVRLGKGWVTLEGPATGLLYLRPLQAGRLWVALHQALDDLALLGGTDLCDAEPPSAELSEAALCEVENSGAGLLGAGLLGAEVPSVGLAGPAPQRVGEAFVAPRRSVLHWQPVTRPTVADIQTRLAAATAEADPEVDHSGPASRLSGAAA